MYKDHRREERYYKGILRQVEETEILVWKVKEYSIKEWNKTV